MKFIKAVANVIKATRVPWWHQNVMDVIAETLSPLYAPSLSFDQNPNYLNSNMNILEIKPKAIKFT